MGRNNQLFADNSQDRHLAFAGQQKKGMGLLILFLFLGAAFGSILTAIFNLFVPSGPLADIFLTHVTVGSSGPLTLKLILVDITIGTSVHINLLNLLGMVLGYYIYRNS
jgi:uncharacterized membrane protein YpjA